MIAKTPLGGSIGITGMEMGRLWVRKYNHLLTFVCSRKDIDENEFRAKGPWSDGVKNEP